MGFAPKGGATARKEWYDRNPTVTAIGWIGYAVAPHASTQRTNVTVPTGRKVMVSFQELHMVRQAAATASGRVQSNSALPPAYVELLRNNVGDSIEGVFPASAILTEGQVFCTFTSDASTGGAIDYFHVACATEFDA